MAKSSNEELKFFLKKLGEKIPCRNMRSYVLGEITKPKYLNDSENYYQLINNVLNLAYIYTYSCYRLKNEDEQLMQRIEKGKDTNLLRVVNVLKKIYFEYEVTDELEQFVLLDLNYAYSSIGDSSGGEYSCRKFIPDLFNVSSNVSLNEMFTLVKRYKISLRAVVDEDIDVIRGKFLELLDLFPFLKSMQLVYVYRPYGSCWAFRKIKNFADENAADKNTMSEETPLEYRVDDVLARRLLCARETDGRLQFFYLKSIENLADNAVFRYSTAADGAAFSVSLKDELNIAKNKKADMAILKAQRTYMVTGFYGGEENGGGQTEAIDDIFYINYKYIKNLAYAIVDSISKANDPDGAVKHMLVNKYMHRFPQLFKTCGGLLVSGESACDINAQNWDNIIAMLLLQDSPSAVLRHIIMKKPETYYKIADNLYKRFNGSMEMLGGGEDALKKRAEDIVTHSRPEIARYGLNSEKNALLLVEARCQIILNSLNKAISGDGERDYTVGNMNANITTLQYMQEHYKVEEKIRFVNFTLCDALKKLICFYSGVFAYGEKKKVYNSESINHALTAEAVKEHKDAILDAFYSAVDEARNEIVSEGCKDDPVKLLKKFIGVCESCYKHAGRDSYTYSENGKNLYVALGKNEILNLKDFKSLLPEDWENAVIDEQSVDEWMRVTLDILRYLKLGANSKNYGAPAEEQFSERAIYPFLSVYSRSSYNEDKCLVSTFSITIDIDGDKKSDIDVNVNVLTEFPYELQMQYYCLPNICTSNKKWWIDPVIINYRRFCERIKEIC